MDRYFEIKKRLLSICISDDNVCAVIAIGSSVRNYSKADEYSDLDLILACKKPDEWLFGEQSAKLGKIKISFVEPTLGGGLERRILFDGSLDVDLIVFTPEQLETAIINGVASEVMNRGYSVLYDNIGITEIIDDNVEICVPHAVMTENEFINMVGDFWFHTIWSSKKILRGELWAAKMCIDSYLKNYLLKIIELYETSSKQSDVWHNGRFLEKWAGEEIIEALGACFAHYEKEDIVSALINTGNAFW